MHTNEAWYIAMFVVWGVLMIVFAAVEIATQQQVGFAAAFGSIATLITHGFLREHSNLWYIEIIIFICTSILAWIVFFALFKNKKRDAHDATDGYLKFLNARAKVIKDINADGFGQLSIDNKEFRFVCKDDVKVGDWVIVKELKGVTMHVEKEVK